jgi:hypothetical protein
MKKLNGDKLIVNTKANANDFQGRFNEILSDPNNKYIPRVNDAGKIIDNCIVMHNGIKVCLGAQAYYGNFAKILMLNKGVHEPQEERAFHEVLKHINDGATMIELGAYWSFYSMWFQKKIKNAKNYMIEPELKHIISGKKNFSTNNMKGDFTKASIGEKGLDFLSYIKNKNIDHIDLLHADIQGAEFFLLNNIQTLLINKTISYLFISTHSQELHYQCKEFLEQHNYTIIASADFDNETYCYDGILVAKEKSIAYPQPINIAKRNDSIL